MLMSLYTPVASYNSKDYIINRAVAQITQVW
jgi:hypothetical protein